MEVTYGFDIVSYKPEKRIYKVEYIFPRKNCSYTILEFCSRNEELIVCKIFVSC